MMQNDSNIKGLPLPGFNGRQWFVQAGPYYSVNPNCFQVKLAVEIPKKSHLALNIPDYSVPDPEEALDALHQVLFKILEGCPVYVGCMGGRGRTGLFLALIAKSFGIRNPVEYVREKYSSHAVETDQQYQFVSNFQIPWNIRAMVLYYRFFSIFSRKKHLTRSAY